MANQAVPSFPRDGEVQRHTAAALSMGDPRLNQHGIRFHRSFAETIQIGWHCDSHDSPDLKSGCPQVRGLGSRVSAVKLRSAKPGPLSYLKDLFGRLVYEDPHDGNTGRGPHQFSGVGGGHGSRSWSKNDAEIRRSGLRRRARILSPHDPTELDLSAHA
jgi:hypothetical protein